MKRKGTEKYKEAHNRSAEAWRKKWPDKRRAQKAAAHTIKIPTGYNRHHWSYNKPHWLDIIILDVESHAKLHRFLEFDEETSYYRTCLFPYRVLDSKEKHLNYMSELNISPFN